MSYICPICGQEFPDRMKLGSHMWTGHKTKMKLYESEHGAILPVVSENVAVSEGLIAPTMVKESKEFVTENIRPANDGFVKSEPKQDNDLIRPAIQTETIKKQNNILNEQSAQRAEQIRSQVKISRPNNPYREMYGNDGGEVWNEFLGR